MPRQSNVYWDDSTPLNYDHIPVLHVRSAASDDRYRELRLVFSRTTGRSRAVAAQDDLRADDAVAGDWATRSYLEQYDLSLWHCRRCRSLTGRGTSGTYCQSCYGECSVCHTPRIRYHATMCRSCFNETYYICSSCSNLNTRPQADQEQNLCARCAAMAVCPCGRTAARDNLTCNRCHQQAQENCLENRDRLVGLELEMLVDNEALPELGLDGMWKYDGSVLDNPDGDDDSYLAGLEWVSYPTPLSELRGLCEKVEMTCLGKARVNRTCGFHVHIDARDLTQSRAKRIWKLWRCVEDVFFGMVADSRQTSNYCRTVSELSDLEWDVDRYYSLNAQALGRHGTLEFRLHQGTIKANRIYNWTVLLWRFVNTFKDLPTDFDYSAVQNLNPRAKLIFLFQQLKLPYSLKKYMVQRLKKFSRVPLAKVAV